MADTLPFDPTAKKELPKPGPRKALTRVQILQLAIRQNLKCGCNCGLPLEPVCIDEHIVPRETLPADRADHIDNRALFNVACAKAKTKNDQAVIGHWRRARGDSGQAKRRKERDKPLIVSRNTFAKKLAPAPDAEPELMKTRHSRDPRGWQKPAGWVSPLSKKYRQQVKARVEGK